VFLISRVYVLSCDGNDRPGGEIAREAIKHLQQDGLRITVGSICALVAERPGEIAAFQNNPVVCLNGCSHQCVSKVTNRLGHSNTLVIDVPDYLSSEITGSTVVGDVARAISQSLNIEDPTGIESQADTLVERKDDVLMDIASDGTTLRAKKGLYYSDDSLWFALENDTTRVGITDYTQRILGEIYLLDLVSEGDRVKASEIIAEIEASKKHLEIAAPISGVLIESNSKLEVTPALINEDPYGTGWLYLFKPDSLDYVQSLKNARQHMAYILELVDAAS